jgi:hypothetical protein
VLFSNEVPFIWRSTKDFLNPIARAHGSDSLLCTSSIVADYLKLVEVGFYTNDNLTADSRRRERSIKTLHIVNRAIIK